VPARIGEPDLLAATPSADRSTVAVDQASETTQPARLEQGDRIVRFKQRSLPRPADAQNRRCAAASSPRASKGRGGRGRRSSLALTNRVGDPDGCKIFHN